MIKKQPFSSSLTFKLSFPIVIFSMILLISISIIITNRVTESIEKQTFQESQNIIDTLTISLQTNASNSNLQRVISTLAANNRIQHVSLIRFDTGIIISDNNFNNIGNSYKSIENPQEIELLERYHANPSTKRLTLIDGTLLYEVGNINLVPEDINRLRRHTILLSYDRTDFFDAAAKDVNYLIAVFSLPIVGMLIAIYLIYRQILTRPLQKFISTINQQARNSDLILVDINSTDELGTLAMRYNEIYCQRKDNDEELAKTRQYIDGITQKVPLLLSYIDQNECYQFANQTHEEWFGISTDNFIGMSLESIIGEKVYNDTHKYFEQAFLGELVTFETDITTQQGKRLVKFTLSPSYDSFAQVNGIYSTTEDITDLKESEHKLFSYAQDLEFQAWALEEQKEKAEDATAVKSDFLASMSHEIRTPMNGVIGMLELLMRQDLEDDAYRYANVAKQSAKSLLGLINDILDFSKIEAGKLELEFIDFNLHDLLSEFCQAMSYMTEAKGLNFILDESAITTPVIKGDPGRLRQILTNLISNATKFTHEGDVLLSVSTYTDSDNQLQLGCTVKDTGIGIPENKLDNLFDSFSQVDTSTTREYGGTGLGLSIVKHLCNLMGGEISVTSEVGVGTELQLHITVQLPDEEKHETSRSLIFERNVIIIDDIESTRTQLSKQLEIWGAKTTTISNIEAANEVLNDSEALASFDILFVEHRLYGELAEIIHRSCQACSEPPSIVSIGTTTSITSTQKLEATAALTKPITQKSLQVMLEKIFLAQDISPIETTITESNTLFEVTHNCLALLVEDNQVNVEIAEGYLEDAELKNTVANNGAEAIEALKQSIQSDQHYDIVLMDCQMPIMDGYEAARNIRSGAAGEDYKDIIIIAMTANAMKGDREKCLEAGMNDYISKPVDPDLLDEKLLYWLNGQTK
jgi:PAS domain S-box-containing protein